MAKEAIREAGGIPFEFNTIGVDDGIAMGHIGMRYSLPSRELIADAAETVINAHWFDGVFYIPNCDKITPGMILAAYANQCSGSILFWRTYEGWCRYDRASCQPF